jgi:hypothetical protein
MALLEALATIAETPTTVFLVGGTSAVVEGWRETTMDVDMVLRPETDALLRAIPALKERLRLNIEFAAPDHFIPVAAGWASRSPDVQQIGTLRVCHYDFTAQALAKIERGHERDLADVAAMLARGLVTPSGLRDAFAAIAPQLYRYPALDPETFARAVAEALR